MENKLTSIIYDLIKDKNLYNYANDEELKNIEINEDYNILGEKIIRIKLLDTNEEFIIKCYQSYKGSDYNV